MRCKAWFRQKADAAVLTLVCVVFLFLDKFTFYPGCGILDRILFPFSHANIFHMAANLVCLWMIKFPKRLPMAFLISFLVSALPSPTWNLNGIGQIPTCGLSGVLFASIGMEWGKYGEFKRMMKYIALPALILGLAPNVNTLFHFYNLFLGFIIYDGKRIRNSETR